ncbi:MAG: DNA polymerase III subunit beta [Alphaproteobacteria bacterium]
MRTINAGLQEQGCTKPMKLTIERTVLLKSLGHVQSVVERRNTIPILSNVLIQAAADGVRFTATDLDIEIVETLEADVGREGATTVPVHTLHDIVRKLPDGAQVTLDYDANDERLTLQSARSRFTLACLPKDDFPSITLGELPHRFGLPADDLARMIDKTRFAISNEEPRYYLNGIYLHVTESDEGGGQVMRAVATDGHRLARFEIPVPDGADGMPGIIVPRKTVTEIRKLLDDAEGIVEVALSETKIRFELADAVLTSKLIDGTFPDYARVIPKANDKLLEVEGKGFADAVDRVSTISAEKTRAVKLALSDGKLVLTVSNPDSGNATEELAVSYGAEPMEIGFNSKYLIDITGQLESDKARILLADAGSPTVVRDGEDPRALYVLMPMRV